MNIKGSFSRFTMALLACGITTGALAQISPLSITDLGSLTGAIASRPYRVNEIGTIIGQSSAGNGIINAYIWRNGVINDLGITQSNVSTWVYGINDVDQIMGSTTTGGSEVGFYWNNGEQQIPYSKPDPILPDLDTPPPYGDVQTPIRCVDINNAGQMIYVASFDGGAPWAMFYNPFDGDPMTLPYSPVAISPWASFKPKGINNFGLVLAQDAANVIKWTPPANNQANGQSSTINVKRTNDTIFFANDMDDFEDIVGSSGRAFKPAFGVSTYYLPNGYLQTKQQILGAPSNPLFLTSLPNQFLSDCNGVLFDPLSGNYIVVGKSGTFTANATAGSFHWDGVIWLVIPDPFGVIIIPTKADTVLPPNSGYHITEVTSINSLGQMTAVALKNGVSHSILLNPAIYPIGYTLNPASAAGGTPIQATVTLNTAALPGGQRVTLTSSRPTIAPVPAFVDIPAGVDHADFTITTVGVSNYTPILLTAEASGYRKQAQLVLQATALRSFTINPNRVTGTQTTTGKIILNGRAPAGNFPVSVVSNMPTVATTTSPVVIPAGLDQKTFTITTSVVTSLKNVTFTATAAGYTRTATLTVLIPFLADLTLIPTTIVGGNTGQGQVTLSAAATTTTVVALRSSNLSIASVPASVTFSAGQTIKTFPIQTNVVPFNTGVTITADTTGVHLAKQLTVTP